jgi:hypothetical protein
MRAPLTAAAAAPRTPARRPRHQRNLRARSLRSGLEAQTPGARGTRAGERRRAAGTARGRAAEGERTRTSERERRVAEG